MASDSTIEYTQFDFAFVVVVVVVIGVLCACLAYLQTANITRQCVV